METGDAANINGFKTFEIRLISDQSLKIQVWIRPTKIGQKPNSVMLIHPETGEEAVISLSKPL